MPSPTSATTPTSASSLNALSSREPHKFSFNFEFQRLVVKSLALEEDDGDLTVESISILPQLIQMFWSRGKKQNGFTSSVPLAVEGDSSPQYTFPQDEPASKLNFTSTLFYDMENAKFKKKTIQFIIQHERASDDEQQQLVALGKCNVDLGQQIVDAHTTTEERSCVLDQFVLPVQLQIAHQQNTQNEDNAEQQQDTFLTFNAELYLHIETQEMQESVESLREKNREFKQYMRSFKKLKVDHAHATEQLQQLLKEKEELEQRLQQIESAGVKTDPVVSDEGKSNTPEPQLVAEMDDLETRRKALEEFIQEQETITKMKEEELREREVELESKYENLLALESDLRQEESNLLEKIRQKEIALEEKETRLQEERSAIERMQEDVLPVKNEIPIDATATESSAVEAQPDGTEIVEAQANEVVDTAAIDSQADPSAVEENVASTTEDAPRDDSITTAQQEHTLTTPDESAQVTESTPSIEQPTEQVLPSSSEAIPQLSYLQELDTRLAWVHEQVQTKEKEHNNLKIQLEPELNKLTQQGVKLTQERATLEAKKKLNKKKREKMEKALTQKETALHAQLDPLTQRLKASESEFQTLSTELQQSYPQFLLNVQRYNEHNDVGKFTPSFEINFGQYARSPPRAITNNDDQKFEQQLLEKQVALDKQMEELQAQQKEIADLREQLAELSRTAAEAAALTASTVQQQLVPAESDPTTQEAESSSSEPAPQNSEPDASLISSEPTAETSSAALIETVVTGESTMIAQDPIDSTLHMLQERENAIAMREAELAQREAELAERLLSQGQDAAAEGAADETPVTTTNADEANGYAEQQLAPSTDEQPAVLEKQALQDQSNYFAQRESILAETEAQLAARVREIESREEEVRNDLEIAQHLRAETEQARALQLETLAANEADLQQRYSDLDSHEATLQARLTEVDIKEASLVARAEEIESILATKSDELARRETELFSSDFDPHKYLEEARAKVEQERQQLEEQQKVIHAQREELREQLLSVQNEKDRLEALKTSLQTKEEELNALKMELSEEKERLEKMRFELEEALAQQPDDDEALVKEPAKSPGPSALTQETLAELEKLRTEKEVLQRKLEALSARPSELDVSFDLDSELDFEDEPVIPLYRIQWNKEAGRFDRIQIQS